MAELWFGAGRGRGDVVVVNLGTGVGAGLALYRGVTDRAGEWGHTTLALDGRPCHCGNHEQGQLGAGVRAFALHDDLRWPGTAVAACQDALRRRAAWLRSASDLPPADATVWDVAPTALADIMGDRLPLRVACAYRRFRYGPGAFKADFAVEGGVPRTAEAARRAGTVHVGGTYAEIAATERDIHAGLMPARPFVLVGQQYLADPQRSVADVHPVWTYAHVPAGYSGDATEAITAQIERFAPGFRDRIVGTAVRTTPGFAAYNPNYVGGNIMTGAKDIPQLLFGPRPTLHPYDTGLPGHYLCSAATPPGPGPHGMCGAHAAARAPRHLGDPAGR